MKQFWIIAIQCLIFAKIFGIHGVDLSFPTNFTIGIASSAYQIEGAWNVSGKGINIWDEWTHNHSARIADGSNGDIACDSYYKYKEDVQLLKSLGVDIYRFSISWTRILPTGFANKINEEGLQYYKNLVAELVANDIQPIATIHHLDHPKIIEDMGGWANELIVDFFVDYARILFRELGDSVKIWATINAPQSLCQFGYSAAPMKLAPGKELADIGVWLCGHNILKAHAKTYRMYEEEFRPTQHGKIGFVSSCGTYIPKNANDTESLDIGFEFTCGWLAHPIYVGDYSDVLKSRIALISKAQGYPVSRLPEFTDEWISIIKGTSDFYGLNHYSSVYVVPDPDEELGIYNSDMGLIQSLDPSWPTSTISWLNVYPPGFRILLNKIKDEYNNPSVWIMENGYADSGEIDDYARMNYHHDYIVEMLTAIKEDGCNVKSYLIWSLMDGFEWDSGYQSKFGLFGVNFTDPARTRTAKLSTDWWTDILATRILQPVPSASDC